MTSSPSGPAPSIAEAYPQARRVALVCATVLLVASLLITVGWVTQIRALLLAPPNNGYSTFNTALLLGLIGAWLLIVLLRPHFRKARVAITAVLLIFPPLVLFEHVSGVDLKIDFIPMHRWVLWDNPVLGMLAPNTALFFIATGLVFLGHDRGHGRAATRLLLLLRVGLALLAFQGLLGYLLELEWLYRWFGFNRMALTTAVGACIASVGVILVTQRTYKLDDARRISAIATAILALVALVTGLTGFAVFKSGMERTIRDNLDAIADVRTEYLFNKLIYGQRLARTVSENPGLKHALSGQAVAPDQLQRDLASDALAFGLSFIQLRDAKGQVIAQVGIVSESSEIELPVKAEAETESTLVWDGSLLFRNVVPVRDGERIIGSVVVEQELPDVEHVFLSSEDIGGSGEFLLCGRLTKSTAGCFPSKLMPKSSQVPLYTMAKPTFPVGPALLGESGRAEGRDLRGVPVMAAYRAVRGTGIALVAKMDTEEVYGPLVSGGTWLLVLPLALLVVASLLIYKLLVPIAKRLQASEQAAREYALAVSDAMVDLELQQSLLRSLTDSMPTLVSFIDRDEVYQYCNEYYMHMFGIRREDIIGKTVKQFFGEEIYASAKPFLERAFAGESTLFERIIIARGEQRILEGRYVPQFDSKGAVTGLYVTGWDVTEARKRERHLSDQAMKDALTGLMNRAAMTEVLPAEIDSHYKHRNGLALLFLDIDHFKQVNDNYGHAAGDELLIAFGRRVREAVRETDFVARFGGDEFVVLLTDIDTPAAAEKVTRKIIESVTQPIRLGGVDYEISTSIGVAYIRNRKIADAELIAEADGLLYAAKQAGRNTYRMADLGAAAS